MTKPIENYTADELSAKIEAIKAEREKTANALKKYEEELERRKQEVPLGVPFTPKIGELYWLISNTCSFDSVRHTDLDFDYDTIKFLGTFKSKKSAEKHAEILLAWRKALVANSKGEPIDIQALLPLLKKGKVLYSPYDEKWKWVEQKAVVFAEEHGWYIKNSQVLQIEGFNLKPAENWKTSLMECGL